MSDPKLISPLLDGFAMGAPMSSHHGVACCPAIKEHSDQKYIVKIITVPAAQAQLDALLLAGAYRDPADAMDYFRQVGEDVMKEAELLTTLSKQEGFLPYEGWQMEPITTKRLGYQVYLVGSYKRSLEKYVRRNPVTHLEAVNLGLDICDALTLCREAGALYVDLKPTNVFMSEKKEYRIGDLGFIQLNALKYTELPDKYRSAYTPPELHDTMATLNTTMDTFALGMMLYQLYNEGQLPFRGKMPAEGLPSPANADYELAEIIMKAIHPDPAQRWETPKAMGQALTGYMQRNVINDTPITPYTALEIDPEQNPPIQEPAPEAAAETPAESISETPAEAPVPPAEEAPAPEAEAPAQIPAPAEVPAAVPAPVEAPQTQEDETLPGEADADSLLPHQMSDELSRMMAKADDLIVHETPEGVVLPEVPELPDPFSFLEKNFDDVDDLEEPFDPVMEEPKPSRKQEKHEPGFGLARKKKKNWAKIISPVLVLALMGLMAAGAFWFYKNRYQLPIDSISVSGDRSQLTVTVKTGIDENLLTAVCSDNYGNVMTLPLTGGKATFTGLKPNTMYRITMEIEGFHELVGETTDIFTTESTTSITSFTAVTGQEDGSVILNFTADGDEPDQWVLAYSTEGEEEKKRTFQGHSITVTDLSVSKVYSFTLKTDDGMPLTGKYTLEYMASRLILAENLTITSAGGNDITVHWNTPGDIVVDNWNVRCYDAQGYEEQVTVTENQVQFTGIDPSQSYTVEVTAAGMTQPARTSITANPINISAFHVNDSDPTQLTLTWDHSGNAPEGGWLVMYSVDGSNTSSVIEAESGASAVISPRIPGASYQFTVQAADATSIFVNVHTYLCPEAAPYEGNGITTADITMKLLKRPENKDWTYDNIGADSFTDTFASDQKISLVLHGGVNFYLQDQDLKILYVVEDTHGNALPKLVSQKDGTWKDVWFAGDYHYGELDLPTAPTTAGSYILKLYFNGLMVAEAPFSIS